MLIGEWDLWRWALRVSGVPLFIAPLFFLSWLIRAWLANVKQVLTILCAVVIFDLTITPTNALGIVLTLVGGALYAAVELKEKKEIKKRTL